MSSLEAKTNTFQLVAERWWNAKKASVTEDYAEDIVSSPRGVSLAGFFVPTSPSVIFYHFG
jgi:hypothetical protein